MATGLEADEFMLGDDSDLVFHPDNDPQQTIDVEVGDVGTVETEVSVDGISLGLDDIHGNGQVVVEEPIGNTINLISSPVRPVETSPEDELRSHEKLDRSSPDLWPQNLPAAAQHFVAKNKLKSGSGMDNLNIWAQGLDPEDINLLHQFGSLTSSSLIEEVKKLQNIAYQLSLEEAKEMTRGKLLHVLDDGETLDKLEVDSIRWK